MRKHDISCHYHLRDSNWLKGTDYVAFTDIKEDQYIDVTKLPNIRIDSSMLRDAVYYKMTM